MDVCFDFLAALFDAQKTTTKNKIKKNLLIRSQQLVYVGIIHIMYNIHTYIYIYTHCARIICPICNIITNRAYNASNSAMGVQSLKKKVFYYCQQ